MSRTPTPGVLCKSVLRKELGGILCTGALILKGLERHGLQEYDSVGVRARLKGSAGIERGVCGCGRASIEHVSTGCVLTQLDYL